jgi:putative SOS response-associated peptidase YedK
VRLKNHEPFAMAGLWESWKNPDTDEEIITYTIITTQANPLMEIVHNQKKRMPVILPDGNEKLWLSRLDKEKAQKLLAPFDQDKMEAYTISKLITARDRDPNVSQVLVPFTYPGVEARLD